MNFTVPGMEGFGSIMGKISNFMGKASNMDSLTILGYIVIFLAIVLIFMSIKNRMGAR